MDGENNGKSYFLMDIFGWKTPIFGDSLVGGFNPFEKYESNWIISPRIGVKIKDIWNHHLVGVFTHI